MLATLLSLVACDQVRDHAHQHVAELTGAEAARPEQRPASPAEAEAILDEWLAPGTTLTPSVSVRQTRDTTTLGFNRFTDGRSLGQSIVHLSSTAEAERTFFALREKVGARYPPGLSPRPAPTVSGAAELGAWSLPFGRGVVVLVRRETWVVELMLTPTPSDDELAAMVAKVLAATDGLTTP